MAETDFQKAKRKIQEEREIVTRQEVRKNSLESEEKSIVEEINEISGEKHETEEDLEQYVTNLGKSLEEKVYKVVNILKEEGKWD